MVVAALLAAFVVVLSVVMRVIVAFVTCSVPVLVTQGTADNTVLVRGSDRHGPVVLRQLPDPALPAGRSRQATVVTQGLNFDGKTQVATLTGKSNATIVMDATTRRSAMVTYAILASGTAETASVVLFYLFAGVTALSALGVWAAWLTW